MIKNNHFGNVKQFARLLIPVSIFIILFFVEWINLRRNDRLEKTAISARSYLDVIRNSYESEKFIANKIKKIFSESKDSKTLFNNMELLKKNFLPDLNFIIWGKKGRLLINTSNHENEEIKEYWPVLNMIEHRTIDGMSFSVNFNDCKILRKVFGPQLNLERIKNCSDLGNFLVDSDSTGHFPLAWVKITDSKSMLAFINRKSIEKSQLFNSVVKDLCRKKHRFKFAIVKDDKFIVGNDIAVSLARSNLKLVTNSFKEKLEFDQYYCFSAYIGNKTTALAFIKKELYSGYLRMLLYVIVIDLILIFILLFIKQLLICWYKDYFSVRYKLLFFFVLFNLIPLAFFAIWGTDYLRMYRKSETSKIFTEGESYLQNCDEQYMGELSYQLSNIYKSLGDFKKSIKEDGIKMESINKLISEQPLKPHRFLILASGSKTFGTRIGVMRNDKWFGKNSRLLNELKQYKKILRLFLSSVNKKVLPQKQMLQLELALKAMWLAEPINVVHEFYSNVGGMWQFGIGETRFPVFIDLFYFFDKNVADYLFFYLWEGRRLELNFIRRKYNNFNRNKIGMKVFIIDTRGSSHAYPRTLKKDKKLLKFGFNLTHDDVTEERTCLWEGKKYFLMGHKGRSAVGMRFLGLYPVSKLEKSITRQVNLFILIGFLSFLLSVSFGLFVSNYLLLPINELKLGINALNRQEFQFRVPKLGNDEFGSLAKIINETMVDFEELQGVGDFKEKVFSSSGKIMNFGEIQIIGKDSIFDKNGKNYFDVIAHPNNKFGVLLGCINQLGVSVTLLAAFIKSCSINLSEFYEQPSEFVHNIQFMLKQIGKNTDNDLADLMYLLIDGETGEIQISNSNYGIPLRINPQSKSISKLYDSEYSIKNNELMLLVPEMPSEEISDEVIWKNYDHIIENFYNNIIAEPDILSSGIVVIGRCEKSQKT